MRIILFLFFLYVTNVQAQQDTLYYFKSDYTGLVGVRDNKGKIIVPAIFEEHAKKQSFKKPITDETIEFTLLPKGGKADFSKVSVAWGSVYSRTGEFLYYPFFEDNGTDYWRQGVRRYVENGKVGFVDKSGSKITAANWDYAGWFNYGYAQVYNGNLKQVYDKGGEYWTLGWDNEIEKYLINKKGQRVEGYSVKKHPKDYLFEGLYYPYPFNYSEEEQEILNSLGKDIVGISIMYNKNRINYKYEPLQLEITERPIAYQPYYLIDAFEGDEKSSDSFPKLSVDKTTKKVSVIGRSQGANSLRQVMILDLENFLNSKKKYDILPETRRLAEKELERLKSQP